MKSTLPRSFWRSLSFVVVGVTLMSLLATSYALAQVGPTGPTGPTGPNWPHRRDGSYWSKRGCGPGGAIGTLRTARTIGTHGTIWNLRTIAGPSGPKGPSGPSGLSGPSGPLGPSGATGPRALNYAYAWKTIVSYNFSDVVNTGPNSQAQFQTNSSYVCVNKLLAARRARFRALTPLTGTCWLRPARASSSRARG